MITATLLATATVKGKTYELRRFCSHFWSLDGTQVTPVFGRAEDAAARLADCLYVPTDAVRVVPSPS